VDGLKDATIPMNQLLHTNLTAPIREAGQVVTNFADVVLPHLGQQVASADGHVIRSTRGSTRGEGRPIARGSFDVFDLDRVVTHWRAGRPNASSPRVWASTGRRSRSIWRVDYTY
jgi:hypothetical protein